MHDYTHFIICCYKLFFFSNSESVASAPIITSLEQISPTAVRVEWSQPSEGATVTGYVVHYSDGSSERSMNVINSTTELVISNLTNGSTYVITVEATSDHLSGESDNTTLTLSTNYF